MVLMLLTAFLIQPLEEFSELAALHSESCLCVQMKPLSSTGPI